MVSVLPAIGFPVLGTVQEFELHEFVLSIGYVWVFIVFSIILLRLCYLLEKYYESVECYSFILTYKIFEPSRFSVRISKRSFRLLIIRESCL